MGCWQSNHGGIRQGQSLGATVAQLLPAESALDPATWHIFKKWLNELATAFQ